MIGGTIYGVVLNDAAERETLGASLGEDPYKAPPAAPVVYIKPRACATGRGAAIPLPEAERELTVSATVALLIGQDASQVDTASALDHVAAACLALDVSVPFDRYYRPPIAQIARDGFLPLGTLVQPTLPDEIVTAIDGEETHRWSLSRLVRSPAQLIADLSQFMTLKAGDLLLVGLPGDAPRATEGQSIAVSATTSENCAFTQKIGPFARSMAQHDAHGRGAAPHEPCERAHALLPSGGHGGFRSVSEGARGSGNEMGAGAFPCGG